MGSEVRGRTTRLESLTDAVFGFSIALLIVSVEVPSDFQGLIDTMKGFAGFALSFAMLILVWVYHYRFFRHFKLEDGTTILLNSLLLFVVLFYVYPLKYVFSVVAAMMSGFFPLSFDEVLLRAVSVPSTGSGGPGGTGNLWTIWFDCEGDDDWSYGVQSEDDWATLTAFVED